MRRFLSPYRVLFAMPRAKRFIATTYVARLGMAMFGVAIVVMITFVCLIQYHIPIAIIQISFV